MVLLGTEYGMQTRCILWLPNAMTLYITEQSVATMAGFGLPWRWMILTFLHAKFIQMEQKRIFTFYVISPHWYDAGSRNPSSSKTKAYLIYIVNNMCTADAITPNGCQAINNHHADFRNRSGNRQPTSLFFLLTSSSSHWNNTPGKI